MNSINMITCPICGTARAGTMRECRRCRGNTSQNRTRINAATETGSMHLDSPQNAPKRGKTRNPTKTEMEYRATLPEESDIRYEAITFRLANGHRYTPDWVEFNERSNHVYCHEVKGTYRLGSYQRARMAFDQARIEFPQVYFIWAEKTKTGWRIEQ